MVMMAIEMMMADGNFDGEYGTVSPMPEKLQMMAMMVIVVIMVIVKAKRVLLVSLTSSRQTCNFTKDFTFISSQHVSTT